MKKALIWLMSVGLAFVLASCESVEHQQPENQVNTHREPAMQSVKGMISYRERIALPVDAVVTVTLEDISIMDARAKVLAQQVFTTEGEQVPFDFELSYDANEIKEAHSYNIRVTIKTGGTLRFTTETITPVITDKNQTVDVNLMLVGVR